LKVISDVGDPARVHVVYANRVLRKVPVAEVPLCFGAGSAG
jgi:hypothetical protein